MMPVAGSGNFVKIGDKIRFPDDVTMGFIIGKFKKITILFDFTLKNFFKITFYRKYT